MTTRIPAILKQVLADHAYPPEIVSALQALQTELTAAHPIRPLETNAPDGPAWTAAWQPYQGRGWLDLPWYFAEAFFYRRLLEAVGYFGRDRWLGLDPFLPRKQAELNSPQPWQVLSAALAHAPDGSAGSFRALLHHCLWGNRVDLSYNKVAETTGRQIVIASEQENLLVDDTEAVLNYLNQDHHKTETAASILQSPHLPRSSSLLSRIDFICDNAGAELLLDLALADFLLRFNWAQQVVLHVKAHPTFVSDATPADVELTLAALKTRPDPELQRMAARLAGYGWQERLHVRAHLFWNSSRFFWELPAQLQAELAQARLILIKGDANYRRLLGDSRWPTTVPMADAVPYFPAPFVALRTLKSDPVVGLKPGQAGVLDRVDSEWRVNGKRGMIQGMIFRLTP
jgi:uncharacterized protein with ATP-grasp and redox domains